MVKSPIRLSSPLMRYLSQALDVCIIWFCGVLAWGITQPGSLWVDIPAKENLLLLSAALTMLVFSPSVYRSWRFGELWLMLSAVGTAWLATVVLMVLWMYLSKSSAEYSRAWFITWVTSTFALLCIQRLLIYSNLRWLRAKGYNYKTVVLVGGGQMLADVGNALAQAAWSGLRVIACVRPDRLDALMTGTATDAELNQSSRTLPAGAIKPSALSTYAHVDEVWLCLPMSDEHGIRVALDALKHSTANIRWVPDLFSLKLINQGVSEVIGIPMMDLSASPMTGHNSIIKACEDYIVAAAILLVVSPLMIAIAIAIKLTSPGPVLYKQRRHGWNGQQILVYKFRSMVVHREPDFQVTQAKKHDARVTPLGAFLRKTSLDELPQFINVLQGRMSVVGPRPHALAHNDYYKHLVPGYMLRHKVKPGITGWAQINGLRGETDTLDKMQRRVDYDLHYIENWSVWLDLLIIFRTLFNGFVHRNAY